MHRVRSGFACVFVLTLLAAAPATANPELWQERRASDIAVTGERLVQPSRQRTLALDYTGMQRLLEEAPLEGKTPLSESSFELALPLPEGGFGRFLVVESPVMEARLAAKFPHIRTYVGQGLDDPTATVRFDTGPLGFRAQILRWPGTSYIEPYQRGDLQHYVAFEKSALPRPDSERMRCLVTGEEIQERPNFQKRNLAAKVSSGENLRTYRLAMAATGEYTTFYGGTVDGALGGIVTTMNRVNGIYEREVAVRMVLVANNDLIIYTNAGTDPYANTSGDLNANQTTIDTVIGSANYDVGHLVGTGGGGVAQLGSVCVSGKARGLTGSSSPIADAFDVDYVAHELGHQFAGNHTFNGSGGSCAGGNRNASTAYEPGSGITIQAYAGICAGDNLQPNSEDYFHRVSLNEILAFTTNAATGGSCGVLTSTGNSFPSVTAPADVTIPISTPFRLTATGSDPNGDTLTYVWEQFDLGTANPTGSIVDTANRPIFRSFDPSPSPTRVFPSLRYILDNANVAPATAPLPGTTTPSWLTAEVLPSTNRTMNFRVTARDNRAGGGGTNEDLILVTSTTAAGPFQVTAPNTAVSWAAGSSQTVTWNVAGTTANGVNTANVEIALSRDGGNTFPTVLLASTPNDGSETFTLPAGTPASTQARIRVAAVGNIFFDISNTNFTITGANTAPTLTVTGSLTTRQGSPAVNGTVATVSDTQDAAGSLAVAVSGVPQELTVSVVNSSGTINMTAQAACTLVTPSGSSQTKTYPVLLTVTDSGGATTALPVNILVGPNIRPTLGAYGNINLARNNSTTNTPAAAPADGNNNLVAPTVSPTTLPGSGPGATLSIASNGVVTVVTDATTSFGTHTVTAQAVDSCGAVALRRFTVTVPVTEPSFTLNSASVITSDGFIEPNECNQINVNLINGGANGTAITGTLSTSNPNLTVTQASANWANLNTGQSGTNLTPFQLSSSAGLSCGSTVNLSLSMNATGMVVPQVLPLSFVVGRPSFPFSENFDAVTAGTLPSGWTTEQTGTAPAAWTTSATGADSAPNAAFTNGRNQAGSNSLVTPSIALPAGSTPAVLRFRHTLNFETPNWDGGVLDVSVNGGAYSDIITAGGSFQSGGYNGTVATGFANPLAGQPAWTGLQSAYGNVAVQLPVSFNGNNIRFRFRGGWDNSTTTAGANWRIDGLSLQAGNICPSSGTGQCSSAVNPNPAFAVGSVTLPATIAGSNNVTRVRLPQIFDSAPVVIAQVDDGNSDPQAVRIANVSATGFDVLAVEPAGANCPGCTGAGPATTVHWIAAKPGIYRLPDEVAGSFGGPLRAPGPGVLIKVGSVSLSNSQRATSLGGFTGWAAPSFANVSFPSLSGFDFASPPVLLSTIQTWTSSNEGSDLSSSPVLALNGASEVWLTPAIRNVTATGFEAALDSSAVDDNGGNGNGVVAAETIGYVAIQAGTSAQLRGSGGALVGLSAVLRSNVNGTCSVPSPDPSFPVGTATSAPNLRGFGGLASRNEDDGGWLRRCQLTAPGGTAVRQGLRVDEDLDLGNSRAHTTNETVGSVVFGSDFSTTPVSLARLTSQRAGNLLDVSFDSATEIGHVGYRIWGRNGARGDWQPLHPDLIVTREGDGMNARSYRRSVEALDVTEIRIEDVDLLGRSRFHEPLAVGSSKGAVPQAQAIDWAAIQRRNAAAPPPRLPSASSVGVIAEVRRSGIQRVAIADLIAQGLNMDSVDLASLAVLDRDQPVAAALDCPAFPSQCEIEWLGEARESLYGVGNAYVLRLDAARALRATAGAVRAEATGLRTVPARYLHAPNRAYSFSAPGADPWFDERLVASSQPVQLQREFTLAERAPGEVRLVVDLWGGLDFPGNAPDHHVSIAVNGQVLAQRRFDGLRAERIEVLIPDALLQVSNSLSIRLPADTGYAADVVLLDGFRVEYQRQTRASQGRLEFGQFSAAAVPVGDALWNDGFERSRGFRVEGVAPASVLWTEIGGRIYRDRVEAPMAVDPAASALRLAPIHTLERPALRVAAAPPDLQAADYLIVSHPQFADRLGALQALQQQRGYRVRVVRTDAIYALGDHEPDPALIRQFIAAIAPRFVLLVGGDSYDYADHLGLGSMSFVPTFYRTIDPVVRFAASDHPLVDANADGLPERALGRLPVRSNDELDLVLQSILARANQPGSSHFGAAGASGPGESFDLHGRALLSYLRQGQMVSHATVDELGLSAARQQTLAALGGAADWISYVGHSSPNRWAFENLLDTSQLGSLNRSTAAALVSQWGCWNNYFVLPNQDTMAHALMLRSNRLAAAVLGSTSLGENASHFALGTRFFDLVEDGRYDEQPGVPVNTLGEALQSAKTDLLLRAPEHEAAAYTITLFGDPAQPLR